MNREQKEMPRGASNTRAVSDEALQVVKRMGAPVNPSDVDSYLRLREGDEYLRRLQELLSVWQEQQKEERGLRRTYATALVWILAVELVLIFFAFFLIGFGLLYVDQWVADVFLIGALTQTSALVFTVVKYLFPARSVGVLQLIQAIQGTHLKRMGDEGE